MQTEQTYRIIWQNAQGVTEFEEEVDGDFIVDDPMTAIDLYVEQLEYDPTVISARVPEIPAYIVYESDTKLERGRYTVKQI